MSAKIDPELKESAEAQPTERVDVIIRTDTDPRSVMQDVMDHGFTIRHTYSLIKALSASGLGASVLELAEEPWVVGIEPDREVRTME